MLFTRNNKPALFDKYRGILIPETPEERVRQKMAAMLEKEFSIPPERISTEYPLSRWDKKSRRRADIIVWASKDSEDHPLLVLEAKAPHIPLTDDVHGQAIDYLETLGCSFYGITNGAEYKWFFKDVNVFRPLTKLPQYHDLIQKASLEFAELPEPVERLPISVTHDESYIQELIEEGIIGQDTRQQFHKIISELDNFILTGQVSDELPLKFENIKIIEDLGISYRSYGNAAGGAWPGAYRSFMLEDRHGDNQIYRISIMGKGKFTNDPVFGNSNANTILIVAIDDFEKSHNSLQMNLDNSIFFVNDHCRIIHDGKITVGKKGSRSPKDLFEFIKHGPIVTMGEIYGLDLGSLPTDASLTWARDKTFILNLLNYAYLRDEFRKSLQ